MVRIKGAKAQKKSILGTTPEEYFCNVFLGVSWRFKVIFLDSKQRSPVGRVFDLDRSADWARAS